jgi:hypothetical protein
MFAHSRNPLYVGNLFIFRGAFRHRGTLNDDEADFRIQYDLWKYAVGNPCNRILRWHRELVARKWTCASTRAGRPGLRSIRAALFGWRPGIRRRRSLIGVLRISARYPEQLTPFDAELSSIFDRRLTPTPEVSRLP